MTMWSPMHFWHFASCGFEDFLCSVTGLLNTLQEKMVARATDDYCNSKNLSFYQLISHMLKSECSK